MMQQSRITKGGSNVTAIQQFLSRAGVTNKSSRAWHCKMKQMNRCIY